MLTSARCTDRRISVDLTRRDRRDVPDDQTLRVVMRDYIAKNALRSNNIQMPSPS